MNPLSPLLDAHISPLEKGGCFLQEEIRLTWHDGDHWCVTGPTASGKTILLLLLSGHSFSPYASITYPLLEEWKKSGLKKLFLSDWISYVPQEVKVPTAWYIEDLYYQRRFQAAEQDNIPTTRSILMNASGQDEAAALLAAEQMHLSRLLDQPFLQLSNGQTRRLMIALALIKQPKLLFLDHPYSGLDQPSRTELNDILRKLANQGTGIFMAALEHEAENAGFFSHQLRLEERRKPKRAIHLTPAWNPPPCPQDSIIEMENLSIAYGSKKVIQALNWRVTAGEHWVIKGKNGSGKSTLLSVIMGDHPQAYANDWKLLGRKRGSGESIWEIKQDIGHFSPELLRYMDKGASTEAIILSGLYDLPQPITPEKRRSVQELSQWLGIDDWLNTPFSHLSFGQQRITLLARAMIRNPLMLILDEPLQGLDLQWREWLKAKLAEFCKGRTTLYITHDEEEIPAGEWKVLQM